MSTRLAGISSMAVRQVLAELALDYRSRTGETVTVESVGGIDAARRVASGEAFDFVVLARQALDDLAASGHVVPDSRIDIARSGIAVAVRSGAPHPDIGTEPLLRDTLLAARAVGYSTGPSGRHLMRLVDRWGVAERLLPRLVEAPAGVPVASLVAKGDVDLGFQQASELLGVPGIDIVGELPPGAQLVTAFAAGVCSAARADARPWLAFCASEDAAAAKRRHGMSA